jgi:peptidoglycan hydrolase-like protein with peptidoglycan-binding domain
MSRTIDRHHLNNQYRESEMESIDGVVQEILGGLHIEDDEAVYGVDVIPSAGVVYTDSATILAVQKALKARHFDPGPIDGVFGPMTAKAIRAMQSWLGVAQTGVIDYGVLMALQISAPDRSKVAADMSADAAADAAMAAERAKTPSDVQAAAQKAVAVAEAAQPPAPEAVAAAQKAQVAAKAATTPAQVAAVKEQVQTAMVIAQQPPWYGKVVLGRPLWQVGLVGLGFAAALTGAGFLIFSGPGRRHAGRVR